MENTCPFAADNSALLLIDHQVGTIGWVRSVDQEVLRRNAAALAKVAKALQMPVVLTSSMEDMAQGPLMLELQETLPTEFDRRIQRDGVVNCWADDAFAEAARATGRKNLILAGVTTDVCLAPPAISAVEDGYRVQAVVDASGSPSELADEIAFRRMERGGVVLTTTNALIAELAENWASEKGGKLIQIMFTDILAPMMAAE